MPHGITKDDLVDADVVDAGELASDGTVVFKTGSIVHASGSYLTASFGDVDTGFKFYSDPVQIGQGLLISGSGNSDGFYYIAGIPADNILQITGSFSGSAQGGTNSGSWSLVYIPGAENVGFNPQDINPSITTAHDVQRAIHDIGLSLGTGVVTGVPPNFFQSGSEDQQSTGAQTFQVAVSASSTGMVSGTYYCLAYAEVGTGGSSQNFQIQFILDSGSGGDLNIGIPRSGSVIGSPGVMKNSTSGPSYAFSCFGLLKLTGSAHMLSLRYTAAQAGITAQIQRARVACWRVI